MLAIEPDVETPVDVDADATPTFGDDSPPTDFAAIDLDVAEANEVGFQPTPTETSEIVSDGRPPPVGWRRDDFASDGIIRRSVWTHPWSTRPPNLEPEQCLSLNKKFKAEARDKWKLKDPADTPNKNNDDPTTTN